LWNLAGITGAIAMLCVVVVAVGARLKNRAPGYFGALRDLVVAERIVMSALTMAKSAQEAAQHQWVLDLENQARSSKTLRAPWRRAAHGRRGRGGRANGRGCRISSFITSLILCLL
jgi:hypothetical protein